eukprot:CAMPEP_0170558500 /NCGR_PEP_ID=MMETSP0211-20121228/35875_1 /TAXON_ID=311385 /ORGANISM="Pseudokeronopsis sp., Strain OXSARD2" /LENGTH=47 /DNA_ID= /DNA_START= /DNA_END= /DNA_ORIENTATION=
MNEGSNAALEDIMKRLDQLDEEMKEKVDINEYKNEIAAIRAMIGNID